MKGLHFLILLMVLDTSCKGQGNTQKPTQRNTTGDTLPDHKWKPLAFPAPSAPDPAIQISTYIPRIHQDRTGNIWLGTNGDGVCRYDGKTFTYFNTTEGFGGTAVRGITEEENGDLWFATTGGVTHYDGKHFTNFTTEDGLSHNQVWSILIDGNGGFWFGTDGGVSRYDGKTFTSFPLPAADQKQYPRAYPTPKLVHCIFQDKSGVIWLGTNGAGVYRYDGKSLTHLSEKDGLCNNVVLSIMQDKQGRLWFGSMFGGVSRYDGSFTNFTKKEGLSGNEVWTMLEDKTGAIWMATGKGVDRYDGKVFTNYTKKDGLANNFVQSILEDKAGNLWFGTSGGCYRFNGKRFINFTKKGMINSEDLK